MIAICLLLALQPTDAELVAATSKQLSGLNGFLADPFKNADELDKRYVALKTILDGNPEFQGRDSILTWMPNLAIKTGRPSEALDAVKAVLQSKALTPQQREGWYSSALRYSFLSMRRNEVLSMFKKMVEEYPAGSLSKSKESVEKSAKLLGKRGATVSLPSIDGKRFSWRSKTKDKVVILYFCASW